MTLSELAFLQECLADAGEPASALVALASAAAEWRRRQRVQSVERRKAKLMAENGDKVAVANRDKIVPVSVPLGRKQSARRTLLMARYIAPQTKAVIGALIDRMNLETGRCDPSRATIASDAEIKGPDAERAVRRAVRQAEQLGVVTRIDLSSRHGRLGGRGQGNRYEIDWKAFAGLDERARQLRVKRGQPTGRNGDKPDNSVPQTLIEINTSTPVERVVARAPVQTSMLLPVDGGKAARPVPKAEPSDAVTDSIKAKFRGDHGRLTVMLSSWWGLDPELRAQFPTLATFEAWLRLHGPPRRQGAG